MNGGGGSGDGERGGQKKEPLPPHHGGNFPVFTEDSAPSLRSSHLTPAKFGSHRLFPQSLHSRSTPTTASRSHTDPGSLTKTRSTSETSIPPALRHLTATTPGSAISPAPPFSVLLPLLYPLLPLLPHPAQTPHRGSPTTDPSTPLGPSPRLPEIPNPDSSQPPTFPGHTRPVRRYRTNGITGALATLQISPITFPRSPPIPSPIVISPPLPMVSQSAHRNFFTLGELSFSYFYSFSNFQPLYLY